MLDALKMSTEPREVVEPARNYLRGVIGDLVRKKKREVELQASRGRPIRPPTLPGAMQTQSRIAPLERSAQDKHHGVFKAFGAF